MFPILIALGCAPATDAPPSTPATTRAVDPAPPPPIPADQHAPAEAPTLLDLDFPDFGTLHEGPATFPTAASLESLRAGTPSNLAWTSGRVVAVLPDHVEVTDLQGREYPVPLSLVLQGSPPDRVEVGQTHLGRRLNRAELVRVTAGGTDTVQTMALNAAVSERLRAGEDPVELLVPVVHGGQGSNAICRVDGKLRLHRVLRRIQDRLLAHDQATLRVLPQDACRFADPSPELTVGQTITYAWRDRSREARVVAIDATTGVVRVAYPWGDAEREDEAFFGSIVLTPP